MHSPLGQFESLRKFYLILRDFITLYKTYNFSAMTWTKWRFSFQCHFKFSDGNLITVDALKVNELWEAVSGTKPAFFVVCPIVVADARHENITFPIEIGITDKKYDDRDIEELVNFIGITYPRNYNNSDETTIAVCPGPIQGKFENALRIAEYVEINKLLGASKFYFYNMSMSKGVENLAKFYVSQGLAEIVTWNIDDVLEMDESVIHYYGIMATLNDCFYRATAVDNFKYVIVTDFDEIIFPYTTETLTEFLEFYDTPSIHSFTFSNYFVFAEYPKDLTNVPQNAVNKFLYTQALVMRMKAVTGDKKWYRIRTKFIAKRDSVTEVGNHYAWYGTKGTKEYFVSHDDAMMYHYREHCLVGYCGEPTVEDFHARKFATQLFRNVDDVCAKVYKNKECPIGTITSRIDS